MRQFNEIFDKVMIEVTPTEVAMLGTDVPTINLNGSTWAEFTTWANIALSPNLQITRAYVSGCGTTIHSIIKSFNDKSAATLKANGFKEYSITADDCYEDDGRPCGPCLVLSIPLECPLLEED